MMSKKWGLDCSQKTEKKNHKILTNYCTYKLKKSQFENVDNTQKATSWKLQIFDPLNIQLVMPK